MTAWVTSTWEAEGKVRIKGAKTASYLLPEVADRLNRGLLAISSRQPFKKKAPCQGIVSTQRSPGSPLETNGVGPVTCASLQDLVQETWATDAKGRSQAALPVRP